MEAGVFIPYSQMAKSESGAHEEHLVEMINWCRETVGYGQHISDAAPSGCDYLWGRWDGGVRFSFKRSADAVRFKLTWANYV